MMEKNLYHCFVAGLPELHFDGSRVWISPSEFKKKIKLELHTEDYHQMEILLYPYDHTNLVRFFQETNLLHEGLATFSASDFRNQQDLFTAILPGEDVLPPYMREVMKRYDKSAVEFDPIGCRRDLDIGYYGYVEIFGSRVVREYTRFEYNISNLLTFQMAAKRDANPVAGVTGEDSFARHLRSTTGKNIVKDPEFEYFDEILSIAESSNLSSAEIRYDQIRWQVIEDITLFEDFTVDFIMGYLIKLLIASRWAGMSEVEGRKRLLEVADMTLKDAISEGEGY